MSREIPADPEREPVELRREGLHPVMALFAVGAVVCLCMGVMTTDWRWGLYAFASLIIGSLLTSAATWLAARRRALDRHVGHSQDAARPE